MARSIIWIGIVITALGLAVWLFERSHVPLGRLPGDFVWKGRNTTFYFPLASSIIASVILTFLFWLFGRR